MRLAETKPLLKAMRELKTGKRNAEEVLGVKAGTLVVVDHETQGTNSDRLRSS